MKTGESNIQESYRLQTGVDEFYLGLDVGSLSSKLVVMTPAREVRREEYHRHLGQPQSLALELLSSLKPEFPLRNCGLAVLHRPGRAGPGRGFRVHPGQ